MAFSAALATSHPGTEPPGHQAPCVPHQARGSAEVIAPGWDQGWRQVKCPPAPLRSAETQHI